MVYPRTLKWDENSISSECFIYLVLHIMIQIWNKPPKGTMNQTLSLSIKSNVSLLHVKDTIWFVVFHICVFSRILMESMDCLFLRPRDWRVHFVFPHKLFSAAKPNFLYERKTKIWYGRVHFSVHVFLYFVVCNCTNFLEYLRVILQHFKRFQYLCFGRYSK